MASQTVSPSTPAQNTLRGTTFTELEQIVEHAFLKVRPPMSLAQIRILLHVFDACEACDGEGSIYSRGSASDVVTQDQCRKCKGRGYTEVPAPVSQ